VWISPTGHRYTRPPGSRLYFPHWNTTTPLPERPADTSRAERAAGTEGTERAEGAAGCTSTSRAANGSPNRGLTMPKRKTSRLHDRTQRLHAERRRNQRTIDDNPPPY
jgi:hypothetical protein